MRHDSLDALKKLKLLFIFHIFLDSRPPAFKAGPNRRVQILDVYWRSLESGDVWYKSRQLQKVI
jgi:hypothetical protein